MIVLIGVAVVVIAVVCLLLIQSVGSGSSNSTPRQADQAMQNAIAAGWNPADGPPPNSDHGTPPAIDPALGHNGIQPTDAKRIA